MIKDASKIFEILTEFCRNNLDILMIGGVGIIMLILFGSGVKCFKNKKKQDVEDISLPEQKDDFKTLDSEIGLQENLEDAVFAQDDEYVSIMESFEKLEIPDDVETLIEKWKRLLEEEFSAGVVEDPEDRVVDIVLPPLTARIVEAQVLEVKENEGETPGTEQKEVFEAKTALKSERESVVVVGKTGEEKATTIESLVGDIATISGTSVKEVEIKVAGARVKITYLGADTEPDNKKDLLGVGDTYKESVDFLESTDHAHRKQIDQINIPEERTAIKFGPDNVNIARSGRVYSLNELEQQIKD